MTFDETAQNYQRLIGELEQVIKLPEASVRIERVADLFHFYLTDVIENAQLATLVEAAIGKLSSPDTVRGNCDLAWHVGRSEVKLAHLSNTAVEVVQGDVP
mgnify:FL=1